MPQLDITTYLPQLVWLAFTFGILYLVMAKSALPRIGEILEERQNRMDGNLEQADGYRKESEKLEADYDQLIAMARTEAQGHMKAERAKMDASLEAKRSEMSDKMDRKFSEAEAGIAKAQEEALGDLENIATGACVSIVARLSGRKLSASEAKRAVKSNLSGKAE